jgi:hypothetical protein
MDENKFNDGGLGENSGGVGSGSMGGGSGHTGSPADLGNDGVRPFTAVGTDAGAATGTGLSAGIVTLLEKFGVNESQISSVRESLEKANVDQALDKAREQVNDAVGKARTYAKQNPGAVLAGIAVLVVGAGLIAGAALKRNSEKL